MRLDEDKLEALRSWGRGLREASSEESAAAGRAILMLIEEIDRLQIELGHLRRELSRSPTGSSDEAPEDMEEPFASTLHERLQRVLEQDDEPPAEAEDPAQEAGPAKESDRTTTSPQSWIDALRRQR